MISARNKATVNDFCMKAKRIPTPLHDKTCMMKTKIKEVLKKKANVQEMRRETSNSNSLNNSSGHMNPNIYIWNMSWNHPY